MEAAKWYDELKAEYTADADGYKLDLEDDKGDLSNYSRNL
jgi:hypothetical protein